MGWKTDWRSFYYETAEEPDDISLDPGRTALLVIDIQNTYLEVPDDPAEAAGFLLRGSRSSCWESGPAAGSSARSRTARAQSGSSSGCPATW